MSDYLTDEEQAARLEGWWERYGIWVIAAVLVAVLGVVGYRWYEDQRAEEQAQGAALYEDFLAAVGDRRRGLAQEIDEAAANTGYPLLVRLRQAADSVAEDNYAAARDRYTEVIDRSDQPAIRDLALVRLARIEQQLGNSEAALAVLQRARSEGFRSLVAELKGDIVFASGDQAAAHEAYVAAQQALADGQSNPLLELKVATTAQGGIGAPAAPLEETPLAPAEETPVEG